MNNTVPQIVNARSQRFSAKNLPIGSLETDGTCYVIPAYQRPYSWTSAQISQLMRDLLDFCHNSADNITYSLGTIVCDEETPGVFSILDGQQRLTTIDILLAEVRRRQGVPTIDKGKRIVSAYRYLDGMETSKETPLPYCMEQRNAIAGALSEFFELKKLRDDSKILNFLQEFEFCIQNRVKIRRVVIPLSDKVENEAPVMFEIVNMRGQKLSALDILKSRLLSRFDEKDLFGRALFTHLWRSTEELLASPNKAAQGYNLSGWNSNKASQIKELPIPPNFTIDEILLNTNETLIESESLPDNENIGNNNNDDSNSAPVDPPIDMMNMLVIANELLKHEKNKTIGEADNHVQEQQALATTDFIKRFDHIVQSDGEGTGDVWRLMGAMSVVLQTVGIWGRYRKSGSDEFEGNPDAFNQLIQTFMAANGFSFSAQYWLLVLSATALESSLGINGKLPKDSSSFLAMTKPAFAKIGKLAELRLLAWAYHVAAVGQDKATEAVFRLLAETPSEETALRKLKETQDSVEAAALKWKYHDGSISQFDLFLTDYVLWVDGHASGNQYFASLKQTMHCFANAAQFREEIEIARAFLNFDWTLFEEKAKSLHIVGRSDIEHWLARNRADLGKDEQATNEELVRRHGFGNLALINDSDNSSLGNGAPAGKSELVLNRMSNPTLKLLWLAVLSQKFSDMSGQHVDGLTKLWASYIGRFSFV